ncbi:MAG: methionyl-tRNA formyltransferase [Alphaproteobacteria bacterium]|nr:methionyl-tRNA formyltransferase [Alphaproteobacteria bacterium]MCL2505715.1 methionyl-tRNA formyltransferase [Alphaproteobacteria bacterium]
MIDKLRIVFMGTPDFAAAPLTAINNLCKEEGHEIIAVYCQPPKPAGRGYQLQKQKVQIIAEELGLKCYTPVSLKNPEEQSQFSNLQADVAVVAAYGLILPKAVLEAPKYGCINIHGSILPKWRGAAPIQRSILEGDTETGITIMQMDEGLDTGGIIASGKTPITDTTTANELFKTLSDMGAELITETLRKLSRDKKLEITPQQDIGASYAKKLSKEDGRVSWSSTAEHISRQVRALPNCFFSLNTEIIKILKASVVSPESSKPEGILLSEDFVVSCGEHSMIKLDTLQRAGKKPMDGTSLLRGLRLTIGSKIE